MSGRSLADFMPGQMPAILLNQNNKQNKKTSWKKTYY